MQTAHVYDEIIDLIASGPSSQRVASFEPSDSTKLRVRELLEREKQSLLTADEKTELDHYEQLEHLMRLAKARAKQFLSS